MARMRTRARTAARCRRAGRAAAASTRAMDRVARHRAGSGGRTGSARTTRAGGRLWGKFSVGVRCQDEASWTLYVPVEIEVIIRVIHTAQPVSMGKQLEAQDIVSKEVDLVRISGEAVTDPDQAIGKVATTFLASGQPIRTHQLRAPHIISRGQKVRLTAIGTGFSVSTEGKALSAAAEGEVVQVRNPTGRIISGIARTGGVVEIKQ